MIRRVQRPLYVPPFDHGHSYITGMCHFTPPLTAEQHAAVTVSKRVIYDGFRGGHRERTTECRAVILVDEECGAGVRPDAVQRRYVTALSTEMSGSDTFDRREFGDEIAPRIEALSPTLAKVLVRYNPEDAALNARQTTRPPPLRGLRDAHGDRAARRPEDVGCSVLGRGADERKAVAWLETAASVPGSSASSGTHDVRGRGCRFSWRSCDA